MPRILAIEADPKRRRVLTELVHEHVKANLVVVASVQAAITAIVENAPDLILAPALLSPADEAELLSHMKQLDTAPYIQMLTVPALDMLADAPAETTRRRGLFGPVFSRQPVTLGLQYDSRMVAAQIVDGLERARELRIEYAAILAYNEAAGLPTRETAMVLAKSARRLATEPRVEAVGMRPTGQGADERRVALRKGRGAVPWLSGINLSWGAEVQLVNISSTGVLVESGSKFAPGTTTDLYLKGPETNIVVPVRFVRSDVARIDGLGVRYHAAAAFAKELDLSGPRGDVPATPPQELAELLGAVLANATRRPEPAHMRFAQGLRDLVRASEVHVRMGSAGSAGPETLYFDVPGDDRLRTTLQVKFDHTHHVTDAEFRLLKAAAWLTAAVLELEKPASQPEHHRQTPVALLAERVA
jgi:CheY-like chemotaxis protein